MKNGIRIRIVVLLTAVLMMTNAGYGQSQRQTLYSSGHENVISSLNLLGNKSLLTGYTWFNLDSSFINFIWLNDSDEVITQRSLRSSRPFTFAEHVLPVSDGFIIGGKSSDTLAFHPFVFKMDTSGNVVWSKQFDNLSFWHSKMLRVLPNGVGYTMYSFAEIQSGELFRIEGNGGGSSFTSTKYNFGSNIIARIFDAESMVYSSSHILSGSGNYASTSNRGGILMKTTPSQVTWCKYITASGAFKNDIVDVITSQDGSSKSLFVCENITGNQYSSIVLKMDSLGNLVWATQLSLPGGTLNGSSLIESNSGEIIVATYNNDLFAYLTRLDASGNFLSNRKWSPPNTADTKNMKLFKDSGGNIILTGEHDSSFFVARLDANGNGCNFQNNNEIQGSSITPVLVNIPVTSSSHTPTTQLEATSGPSLSFTETILCGVTGIPEEWNSHYVSVFPNPSGDVIHIDFPGIPYEKYCVDIFNLQGERIRSGVTANPIDISKLASGVYFIEVRLKDRVMRAAFTRE